MEAAKGGKLEAGVKEGVFSKLTSSLAVKPTGKLKIEDKGGLGAIWRQMLDRDHGNDRSGRQRHDNQLLRNRL